MALRIRRCRLLELLGDLPPAEFARRMGVHESTVSRWMKNERVMSIENAMNAARILDCYVEDLYEWVEE